MKHITLPLFLCSFMWIFSQEKKLHFKPNGEFKILQLTDIHWSDNPEYTKHTQKNIEELIHTEQPDMIVLTGDNVNSIPMKMGWDHLSKIFQTYGKPWTVVFGNHDAEQDWTNTESMEYLKNLKGFVGESGSVTGSSNFSRLVWSADGSHPGAKLYFLDSGDYTRNPKFGQYAWIQQDQIQWFQSDSRNSEKTYGRLLPSLMFFHIPLPEYASVAESKNIIGSNTEDVSSSEINSGLFASLIERKEVMGTFCGHDHNNDFIGSYRDIALAYGHKSGKDGYGDLPLGGRVIIIYQDLFRFHTYIREQGQTAPLKSYYFPSGLSEIQPDTPVLEAKNNPNVTPGIHFTYHEGFFKNTNEILSSPIKNQGILNKITLSTASKEDHYGFRFTGWFRAPHTGLYRFYTYSDDGSILKIGEKIVVENDGGHSPVRKDGIVALKKGLHKFELIYFEDYMGQSLEAGFSSLEIPERPLDDSYIFQDKN